MRVTSPKSSSSATTSISYDTSRSDIDDPKGAIKIYARLRRAMPWESDVVSCKRNSECAIVHRVYSPRVNRPTDGNQKSYEFTKVFDAQHNNLVVFEDACVPLLQNVLRGFNTMLITYGQTGSGKTYSVLGKHPNTPGVLHLSIQYLLSKLGKKDSENATVKKIELSAVETFGKHVAKIELFDLCNKQNLEAEEWKNKQGSTVLDIKKSVQRISLQNYEEASKMIHQIHLASHFAPTGKNPKSSRGHVAFIVHVTMEEESLNMDPMKKSNIKAEIEREAHYIVLDLAGSEGESALTDDFTKGMNESEITDRRLEAWCINHGLLQIQEIFKEMREHKVRKTVGSGLRRTLHQYLNNNMYVSVLFALSPSVDNSKSTMSTLRFAETASLVKVTPMKAKVKLNKDQVIQQLQDYLNKLEGVVSTQKTTISQLQEQVFGLHRSKSEGDCTKFELSKVEEAIGLIMEEEKVTEQEKPRLHDDNNPLLTLTKEMGDEIPVSFGEFIKKNFNIDDNLEKIAFATMDEEGEWKIENNEMRLSAEESLQLENELTQELSEQRRMSRAQDVTLLQFVQSLEQSKQMTIVVEKEEDEHWNNVEQEGDKDETQEQENNTNTLQVIGHNEKENSPTPAISEPESEISQLSEDEDLKLNDERNQSSVSAENEGEEGTSDKVKDMLDGRIALDIHKIDLNQVSKDSLILLLKKLDNQAKKAEDGNVVGIVDSPNNTSCQNDAKSQSNNDKQKNENNHENENENETEELPLIVNSAPKTPPSRDARREAREENFNLETLAISSNQAPTYDHDHEDMCCAINHENCVIL